MRLSAGKASCHRTYKLERIFFRLLQRKYHKLVTSGNSVHPVERDGAPVETELLHPAHHWGDLSVASITWTIERRSKCQTLDQCCGFTLRFYSWPYETRAYMVGQAFSWLFIDLLSLHWVSVPIERACMVGQAFSWILIDFLSLHWVIAPTKSPWFILSMSCYM